MSRNPFGFVCFNMQLHPAKTDPKVMEICLQGIFILTMIIFHLWWIQFVGPLIQGPWNPLLRGFSYIWFLEIFERENRVASKRPTNERSTNELEQMQHAFTTSVCIYVPLYIYTLLYWIQRKPTCDEHRSLVPSCHISLTLILAITGIRL